MNTSLCPFFHASKTLAQERIFLRTHIVQVNNQAIAVHESEGSGPPIVLVHGNSSSGLTFSRQLFSPLGSDHHLVAIDLPGHGESDRAQEPGTGYSVPGYAKTLVAVCEQLGLNDAVFVGWSLGGHVVLEASALLPRAAGFMIFGTPPIGFPPDMAGAFFPHPAMAAAFKPNLSEAEIEAFVAAFFKPGSPASAEAFKADVRRADGNARLALAASIQSGGYEDELSILAGLTVPLAILHGEQEQLVSGAYLNALVAPTLWRSEVQTVADAGHALHWEQRFKFNALLDVFAHHCQRRAAAARNN